MKKSLKNEIFSSLVPDTGSDEGEIQNVIIQNKPQPLTSHLTPH